jgi:cytoskeletal protein RodZ
MESAGERLRRVRLERGLDLRAIAGELRISARYLEAIENGDLKSLPGGFFSKSFYRQYGTYLDVCDQQFDAAVDSLFISEEAVPLGANSPLDSAPGIAPMPTASKRGRARKPLISLAVLLVVVAACSGMFALWQRLQQANPIEQAVRAKPAAPAANAPQVAPAVQVVNAVPASSTSEPATPAPAVPSGVVLNLSATEQVWISVTSEGKVLFSGVLEPSQSKALDTGENARILIGNAGGLDVQWKGRSLGPIGPRGQVRILVLKPEGFEILPPKKDAQPKL